MIKAILSLSFVFSNAFAATTSWVKVSETFQRIQTTQEFVALQNKYPEYLGQYDANLVISAFVIQDTWKFNGQTSCALEDSRRVQQSFGFGICLNDVDGTCFSQSTPIPTADPCGN